MARFQYRLLSASVDDYGRVSVYKRTSGDGNANRSFTIKDSARDEVTLVTDERGEERPAFKQRATNTFLEYLNALANEGWQVVSRCVPEGGRSQEYMNFEQYPFIGHYLLQKQFED